MQRKSPIACVDRLINPQVTITIVPCLCNDYLSGSFIINNNHINYPSNRPPGQEVVVTSTHIYEALEYDIEISPLRPSFLRQNTLSPVAFYENLLYLLHHEYPGFRAILKLCDDGATQGLPCDLPRGPSAPHDLVP